MKEQLEALEAYEKLTKVYPYDAEEHELWMIIESALKEHKILKEENEFLKENLTHLDDTYFDTWYACQRLKENSDYALMFVDNVYCLVDTADNKYEVIDTYETNSKGIIIDGSTQKKLKALEIIKEKSVIPAYIVNTKNLEEYNKWLKEITYREDWLKRRLTQEEYELLKEELL